MRNENNLPVVEIWADGAAEPNPGTGGFGTIIIIDDKRREYSQGYHYTTNNRMELRGVIHGLKHLRERSRVEIFSDSQYVVLGINEGRAVSWRKNGYKRSGGRLMRINYDLWDELLNLTEKHKVKFTWIKGHSGIKENEEADALAHDGIIDFEDHIDDDVLYLTKPGSRTYAKVNNWESETPYESEYDKAIREHDELFEPPIDP